MNTFKISFLSIGFFIALFANSQTIRFDKYYTIGYWGLGHTVIPLNDDYIIAGYQDNDPTYQQLYVNPLVVKTNLNGDTVFTKKYGSNGWDIFQDMCKTNNNYFICVGSIQDSLPPSEYDYDLYIVKIDSIGDTIWTKRYSCPSDSSYGALTIIVTKSKDIIIAGYQYSWNDSNIGSMLFKLDKNGSLIWRKWFLSPYPYPNNQTYVMSYIYKILEAKNKDLIAVGKRTTASGIEDPIVFRMDSTGKTLWLNTYGGTDNDFGTSIVPTNDGNYIASIMYKDLNSDYKISFLKIDTNGTKIWQKNYYSIISSGNFAKAIPTLDGGYVGTGGTDADYTSGAMDGFLIKVDANGDSLWMRFYGTLQQNDWFFDVEATTDKGFVMTGETYSYNIGGSSVWLVKVDSLGLLIPLGINEEPLFPTAMLGDAFPNPTNSNCTISYNIPEFKNSASLFLFNMQGKQLADYPLKKGENSLQLNLSDYAAGTYLYVLAIDNYNVKSGKVEIVK